MQQQYGKTKCQDLKYVDVRGYYDLASEIICLILSSILFVLTIKSFRNLQKDKQQNNNSQYQQSLRRKIMLNFVQIAYLTSFCIASLFSIYLFIPVRYNLPAIQNHKLQYLFKACEIIYVNLLNSLNVTVGFLYWKATRGYYVLSEVKVPFLYIRFFKVVFVLLYSLNLSTIIISTISLYTEYIRTEYVEYSTLFTTVLSIVVCLGCRTLFRYMILSKIQLSDRALNIEMICSILIFTSSLLRIGLYAVQVVDPNWAKKVRNYQSDYVCIDTTPYYALCLFGIDILINLLPSAVYYYLFRTQTSNQIKESRRKNKKAYTQKFLQKRKRSQQTNSYDDQQQQI